MAKYRDFDDDYEYEDDKYIYEDEKKPGHRNVNDYSVEEKNDQKSVRPHKKKKTQTLGHDSYICYRNYPAAGAYHSMVCGRQT